MCSKASRSYPKTNTLGSAKVDCHTCLRLHKRCDRQRPQCGPCVEGGRKCGGFVTDIIWKNVRQSRQGLRNAVIAKVADEEETEIHRARPAKTTQSVRFVQNGARRRRKTSKLPKAMEPFMTTIHATSRPQDEGCGLLDTLQTLPSPVHNEMSAIEGFEESLEPNPDSEMLGPVDELRHSPAQSSSSSPSDSYDSSSGFFLGSGRTTSDSSEIQWQGHSFERALQLYGPAPAQREDFAYSPLPLFPGLLYSTPAQKAAAILDMCKQPAPTRSCVLWNC